MKVQDKRSTPAVGPARAPSAPSAPARVEPAAGGPAAVPDVASVMGIPEAEFTPRVRQAIMTLLAEVESLRRELKDAGKRVGYLERLADQDTLVPVVNRRAFVRELSRVISYARRYDVPCSVLYFDVNGMKEINDQQGHAAGDAALAHVAETLTANVRESDVVGRLGGDEFGVILVHGDEKVAAEKAAMLAAAVEAKPLVYRGTTIPIHVAHGSYQFRPEDESADDALDAADKAMYAQKSQRGGRGKE
jgi:diguanylate cyclase (GGDEF)-like protein